MGSPLAGGQAGPAPAARFIAARKTSALPRGAVGLHNLGCSSYLNAVLQCLAQCPPLVDYFLEVPTTVGTEMEAPPQEAAAGAPFVTSLNRDKAFAVVMETIWAAAPPGPVAGRAVRISGF